MCQQVLTAIHHHQLNANLSVKPTSLGLKIDPEWGYQNIRKLVEMAAQFNNFVHLDMENSPYTATTIELFQKLRQKFSAHIGIVLQAYLVSVRKSPDSVIARNAFCDEAISRVLLGDCFGKKRLAMTGLGIFGQTLLTPNHDRPATISD